MRSVSVVTREGGGFSAIAIDPGTPATMYAGTNGSGVFKSTNGGANWTAANIGLTITAAVTALAIHPANLATLYAGIFGGGIFKSTNGGAACVVRADIEPSQIPHCESAFVI